MIGSLATHCPIGFFSHALATGPVRIVGIITRITAVLQAAVDLSKILLTQPAVLVGSLEMSRVSAYPKEWPEIATRVKRIAGWRCERCDHIHEVESGHVLTVHHLDGNKSNCLDWNLAALCQRCHLKIQGRVKMNQLFMLEIIPVSGWFKPHYEGYLQSLKTNNENQTTA